jgi:hypothetical protein
MEGTQHPAHDIEILRTNLVMKDHELFALRAELDRRGHEFQMLVNTIERLEKTMAACYDRLARKVERTGGLDGEARKRRRRG